MNVLYCICYAYFSNMTKKPLARSEKRPIRPSNDIYEYVYANFKLTNVLCVLACVCRCAVYA